tara:strand:+ start:1371 stop:2489 length:1119 start_codon:yes stop_codon:yes gene_type:complete
VPEIKRILVTGAHGFIGKNLCVRLAELPQFEVLPFGRDDSAENLLALVRKADAVVHLAAENRPKDDEAFIEVNVGLTETLCRLLTSNSRMIPILFASSAQAVLNNPYGFSKLRAERTIEGWANETGGSAVIYRLPGVFGKWCRPNYNSVVATFCSNVVRGLPLQINAPEKALQLVYIDDVVAEFVDRLQSLPVGVLQGTVAPEYAITLGELAQQINAFKDCRTSLQIERVGVGLTRALYATYVSYLPPEQFSYDLPQYGDERGVFVEMLKTPDAGQFSFFTALPGVTRGGHYHHTKTEKFLVLKGKARFGFRHIVSQETFELITNGQTPQVVETVPGWTHDITNIGEEEMVVMLWANEIFDRQHPDTIACKV